MHCVGGCARATQRAHARAPRPSFRPARRAVAQVAEREAAWSIFPPAWRVGALIVAALCKLTKAHVGEMLETQAGERHERGSVEREKAVEAIIKARRRPLARSVSCSY